MAKYKGYSGYSGGIVIGFVLFAAMVAAAGYIGGYTFTHGARAAGCLPTATCPQIG
jgi:hypothetical protein